MLLTPFAASTSIPGHGQIHLANLSSSQPVLRTLAYQYPLKLIAPAATKLPGAPRDSRSDIVYTVFFLTYGGGLVGGDGIDLHVNLAASTKLIILTQGSTKIFKSPSGDVLTTQKTTVNVRENASLCYLPDPVQPFEHSAFEQTQIYHLANQNSNICVCDWVSEGRSARGEKWSFYTYSSRNEMWTAFGQGKETLLLRDNLILDNRTPDSVEVRDRMDGLGVFGTLIMHGSLFEKLGNYFLLEFKSLPRIGNRQWEKLDGAEVPDPITIKRAARLDKESLDGVLWSCAATRGFFVVKFGAREVEGARHWLRHMLHDEGTIEKAFGERALLCLK